MLLFLYFKGNIPIPLIKGEIPYHPIDYTKPFPKYEIAFFGSIDHGHRKMLLDNFVRLLKAETTYSYKIGPSKTWVEDM